MTEGEEASVAASPLVGDAEGKVLGDPAERWRSQTRPGKRRPPVPVDIFEPGGAQLFDVVRAHLDEENTRRGDELDTPAQQSMRVAADADVAVDEQDGSPVSLGR